MASEQDNELALQFSEQHDGANEAEPKQESPVKDAPKITATDIYRLLAQKYSSSREWVIAGEVQRTTGWSDRRYDFVAMNCFASTGHRIEVVEIKVSKPDLRRELEEPEKHNVIFEEIDYYSLAAPADIIDMSIIPPKWGVYAVKNGKLITKRKPLALHDEADRRIKRAFAASFLRAAVSQNLEKKTLAQELQKRFDDGYEKGRKSLIWDSQKEANYELVRKEANTFRTILNKLGFPVCMGDCKVKDEQFKSRLELLMNMSNIIKALDSENIKWAVRCMEDGISQIKGAMERFGKVKEGVGNLLEGGVSKSDM